VTRRFVGVKWLWPNGLQQLREIERVDIGARLDLANVRQRSPSFEIIASSS
jgi:hypothetical protein